MRSIWKVHELLLNAISRQLARSRVTKLVPANPLYLSPASRAAVIIPWYCVFRDIASYWRPLKQLEQAILRVEFHPIFSRAPPLMEDDGIGREKNQNFENKKKKTERERIRGNVDAVSLRGEAR